MSLSPNFYFSLMICFNWMRWVHSLLCWLKLHLHNRDDKIPNSNRSSIPLEGLHDYIELPYSEHSILEGFLKHSALLYSKWFFQDSRFSILFDFAEFPIFNVCWCFALDLVFNESGIRDLFQNDHSIWFVWRNTDDFAFL